MPKKLQDKSTHSITLFEEDNYIEIIFKTLITAEKMKKVNEKTLEYIKKYRVKGCLNDMGGLGVIPEEVQDYIQTEWAPQMMQLGVVHWATVMPKSASSEFSQEELSEEVRKELDLAGIKTQHFKTLNEARGWLLTIK